MRSEDSQRGTVLRRLIGFTGWPLLTLITPLVATPTIARLAGDGWSSMATAMSIGTFGAAAVLWGWNYVGPARVVALRTDEERHGLYERSVAARALLCVLVLPVCAAVSAALALPSLRWSAGALAVAFALPAMSPQWYCIGIGSSRLLGLFDTLPRTIATVVAVPIMIATKQVLVYPVVLTTGILLGLALFRRTVFPDAPRARVTLRETVAEVRSSAGAAGANLVGAAYGYTPTPIATAFLAPLASSRFASADQLYRYALFLVQALGNALQGWVLEVHGEAGRRRQALAIWAHLVLGLVGGAGLALLTPWVSALMFGRGVAAGYPVSVCYGIAFFAISTATPLLRNVLIPRGHARAVLVATSVAAVVGVAMMLLGGTATSALVIAAGMAASELLILVLVTPRSRRLLATMTGCDTSTRSHS